MRRTTASGSSGLHFPPQALKTRRPGCGSPGQRQKCFQFRLQKRAPETPTARPRTNTAAFRYHLGLTAIKPATTEALTERRFVYIPVTALDLSVSCPSFLLNKIILDSGTVAASFCQCLTGLGWHQKKL